MIYEQIKANACNLEASSACEAFGVSRSGYEAWLNAKPTPTEPQLLEKVQEIAAEFPRYGYRRITKELARRRVTVNHKKVLRITRENNLLCKKQVFRICTTNSNHDFKKYPNLAKDLEVKGLNQLWVSDITYVSLEREFAYLAAILDVFSRKCIGWQLSRYIDAALCVDALQMAFQERQDASLEDLVHHSDQGVQYASNEYTALLESRGIAISMSRKGNPYDNAFAESFIKTLKHEEVHLNEYASFREARENIHEFIEVVYNRKRLHSSIGYLPPAEFEAKQLKRACA